MMNESSESNKNRDIFFRSLSSGADVDSMIIKLTRPLLNVRIKTRLKYVFVIIVKQMGLYTFVRSLIRKRA
jgi:hypothetical protein